MDNLVIVIPSYEPDNRLILLVDEIMNSSHKFFEIIIINDGSNANYDFIFEELSDKGCVVLKHAVNLGKGRGIKTSLNYILNNYPHVKGMITIDSDGQHKVKDMLRCVEVFKQNQMSLILGVRDFVNDVPFKSKFGNIITRNVLGILTGIKLKDTQTGLRIIPRNYMEDLIELKGERFDYEMNMIIQSPEFDITIVEVPIETIYIEDNESSHFRPLIDSISIYASFLKYAFSSLSSSLLDIVAFTVLFYMFKGNSLGIVYASLLARLISSLYNYYINMKLVFKSRKQVHSSLGKYYVLVVAQITISTISLSFLAHSFSNANVSLLKLMVDTTLFVISYQIQRKFIF